MRGDSPLVSPDGRTIAFTRNREKVVGKTRSSIATLWLAGADGSHSRMVRAAAHWLGAIAWSQDSNRLLIEDGRGLALILRRDPRISPVQLAPHGLGIGTASLSPDGKSVA